MKLRILVVTWNVATTPPPASLAPLLEGVGEPELLVIGLQETQMDGQALVFENAQLTDAWLDAIVQGVHNTLGEYETVAVETLVGMQVVCMVKRSLAGHIEDVDYAAVARGPLGAGNKGCAAIRMRLGEQTFCLVSAHLSAHEQYVAQRNADYNYICENIRFTSAPEAVMMSHDYVVFFGDLNYRCTTNFEKAVEIARSGVYDELLSLDQLSQEVKNKTVFNGFEEAPINFPPTFKFIPGTDEYQKKNNRVPSYTDRIFFKGRNCHVSLYEACERLQQSDHRPVRALLEIQLTNFDSESKPAKKLLVARRTHGRLTAFGQNLAYLLASILILALAYRLEILAWLHGD